MTRRPLASDLLQHGFVRNTNVPGLDASPFLGRTSIGGLLGPSGHSTTAWR